MNKHILNTEIQEFINNNLYSDIHQLLLKGKSFDHVEIKEIVQQIEAKLRSKKKLPTWFKTKNIYYPNKLNIEQTSSEITASYKSKLVHGINLIDVTGGFGVDCFYFAKQFKKVIHCEVNKELSEIARHNFINLGAENIQTISVNGLDYLTETKLSFDWIYVDPSRRHDEKGKVFFLNDCIPNIPEHLDLLFQSSSNILIKTSPLLDLSIGMNELNSVNQIHIVAVNNEVKELLWLLKKDFSGAVKIKTVNIKPKGKEIFNFILNEEKCAEAIYSQPLAYLYEPNSAILKSGAFNLLSQNLNVFKLHIHSHLYTSDKLISFPGRGFQVHQVIEYNKKNLQKLNVEKANITTRNFPQSVETIRKKLKIKDGGDHYLFFTTNLRGEKIVISTSKV